MLPHSPDPAKAAPADAARGGARSTGGAPRQRVDLKRRLDVGKETGKADAGAPPLLKRARVAVIQRADAADRPLTFASVGAGPRGAEGPMWLAVLYETFLPQLLALEDAGARFCVDYKLIERGGLDAVARGLAWNAQQGASTVNSHTEVLPDAARLLLGQQAPDMDHTARIREYLKANLDRLTEGLREHPVVLAMLERRVDGTHGTAEDPMVRIPVLPRAEQGKEEFEQYQRIWHERLRQKLPFFEPEILLDTCVDRIDLSDPHRPKLELISSATHQPISPDTGVDSLRVNTGTTLADPRLQPEVLKRAYVGAMNTQALRDHLRQRCPHGIDEDGILRGGVRLLLGGTRLSAQDAVLALDPIMKLFARDRSDPDGFSVNETARARHPGGLTFVSGAGVWHPPRHAWSEAWWQKTEPLGNIEEQHALFLHGQGEEVFRAWALIADASVAVAHGVTPRQLRHDGETLFERLKAEHEGTLHFHAKLKEANAGKLPGRARQRLEREATQTPEGGLRQAYLSTILGLGMSRDPKEAAAKMERNAPWTFRGRQGYPMHRAQLCSITQPGSEAALDNAALVDRFNAMMAYVTASPIEVHSAVFKLFEAGIARHLRASYEDIEAGADEKLLLDAGAGKEGFDAFLVSKVFGRDAEGVIARMKGQVEPAAPGLPDLPRVGRHRRIETPAGLSHCEDHSLNGKGSRVPRDTVPGAVQDAGPLPTVNAFSTDINNRESAIDEAIRDGMRGVAMTMLAGAGFIDPVCEVERLYDRHRPTPREYEQEVARFAAPFRHAMLKAKLLQIAEQAAGDNAREYCRLATAAASGDVSRFRLALVPPAKSGEALKARYQTAASACSDNVPAFKPPSWAEFSKRFVDAPMHVHEQVVQEAFALALQTLKDRGGEEGV